MTLMVWIGSALFMAIVIGIALLTVGLVTTLSGRNARAGAGDEPRTAAAARSHALRIHVAAWFALVVTMVTMAVAASIAQGLEAGRITGIVLAAGGLAFLAVTAFGEITWPRPTGSVRTATLSRRSVRDVTPRPAALLLAIASGLLLLALVVGGLTALPDDRSYGRTTVADGVTSSWASSPYPGWFYALPLALAACVILAATLGCLVLIARRPAISDASSAWDLAMRQLSGQRTLRGATLALGATAAPVYGLLALPFLQEGPWVVAVLFVLGGLASVGVGAAALALPVRRLPAAAQSPGSTPGSDPVTGATPGGGGSGSGSGTRAITAAAQAAETTRRIGWTLP